MNSNKPDDFILATGKAYTVKEFCNKTAAVLNINLVWNEKNES